ncbi:MAG: hypothetical protein MZV64_10955 [Ignavibacteriales bacterium]|nr:hypothetical protein [Ignavibacteriales bacterium]
MGPKGVSSSRARLSIARTARPRSGSPAMTAQLCVLMKIFPKRFVFEPIFRSASPKARTYHSPSQAWVSIASTSRSRSAADLGMRSPPASCARGARAAGRAWPRRTSRPRRSRRRPCRRCSRACRSSRPARIAAARAGPRLGPGEAGHGQQVLEDRALSPVEEGLLRVEQAEVARLLEIFGHRQDEPERIVAVLREFALAVAVEVVVDLAVAPHLAGQQPDPGPGLGRGRR